ncbi:hypothetical protein WJX84_009634 [Apatococcus fuscideae]|uniref:Uncharacterized protein n=1 Tax=Apatococcus fuscideae TaxID=2026836 RepID=A0AAW1T2J6_9CHLO
MKLRFCLLHFSLPLKAVVRDCCAATWVFILEQLTFPSFQRLAKRHKHSAVQLTRLDQKKVLQRALTGLEKANGPGNLKDPAGVFVSSDDQNLPEGDYVFIPAVVPGRLSDDDEEHVAKRSKRDADVEDRLRVLEEALKQSSQMSHASEGEVTEVLRAVGLMEVRDEDDLEGPPDDFLCDGLDPFRMQDYQQETDTYEPFKEKLEASLKQDKDLIGKGGFQVAIVSNNNALTLEDRRAQAPMAVYNMLQMLREASKDPLFRLERHKDDPKLDQQAAASVQHLRQVPLSLTLLCIAFKLHVFHDYCRYPVQYIMPHRSRAWNTYSLALTF